MNDPHPYFIILNPSTTPKMEPVILHVREKERILSIKKADRADILIITSEKMTAEQALKL